MAELHRKYRPLDWDQVIGQDAVVKGIRDVLRKKTAHSFVFTGGSGVGKTTAARIVSTKVGCTPNNLLEIDAATNNGVDIMRALTEGTAYKAFGESAVKVLIIDECHILSKQAWQSLLKSVEEPPAHCYWIFCTTEAGKIPTTIETRCACFEFKPVPVDDIQTLLEQVVTSEGYETPEEVTSVIARQSFGSPRRALTYLAKCYACQTAKEALTLLQRADEEGDTIILARALVKGLSWAKAVKILKSLENQNPESIRIVILAYLTKIALDTKSDQQAGRVLELLDCFSEPYNSSEGFAPLLVSLGRAIFR